MIQQMFSIQDVKTQTFNPPFYQKNVGEACHTFEKLANDSTSIISEYPEDFVLVHLGGFCDDTGEIISIKPTNVGTAVQYVKAKS